MDVPPLPLTDRGFLWTLHVYFRFTAGLLLALLVSIAGIWLEKQTLELRRSTGVQHYHAEILRSWLVRRRLQAERLTMDALQTTEISPPVPTEPTGGTASRRGAARDRQRR
ncbi:MAG: hypothetical protein ACK5YC_02275 [Planctomyces sp.]